MPRQAGSQVHELPLRLERLTKMAAYKAPRPYLRSTVRSSPILLIGKLPRWLPPRWAMSYLFRPTLIGWSTMEEETCRIRWRSASLRKGPHNKASSSFEEDSRGQHLPRRRNRVPCAGAADTKPVALQQEGSPKKPPPFAGPDSQPGVPLPRRMAYSYSRKELQDVAWLFAGAQ